MGRLIVMKAGRGQGDFARQEVSMAKVNVADTLHKAVDTAIQLNGARGYSRTRYWNGLPARPALSMAPRKCTKWSWPGFIAATRRFLALGRVTAGNPRDMEAKMFDPSNARPNPYRRRAGAAGPAAGGGQ